MMDAKYITFNGGAAGWPDFAVIFPPYMEHLQMRTRFSSFDVLGAGFVSISGDKANAHGRSIGLEVASRGDADSNLLNQTMRLGDYKD